MYAARRGEQLLIAATKRRPAGSGRIRLPVSEVLYCSHPELLEPAWAALCPAIAWGDRTLLVALDDSLDPGHRIAGGHPRERIRVARGLQEGEHADALYSELVLLN